MKNKERTYSVYRHTSPSGKVYIGITCQPVEHRWNNGKGYMNLKKSIFKSTIIKYGWDNIKHEVLFTGLFEERAKKLEVSLIRHYKKLGISLNITDGGEGCHGIIPWNKGIKMPESMIRRGYHYTEEQRKKMSLSHMGKHKEGHPWTPEQRTKLLPLIQNRRPSEETKRKISAHSGRARAIVELDKNGVILRHFRTIREAAQYVGIDEGFVGSCCERRVLCQGHILLFETDNMDISDVRYGRYKDGSAVTIKNVKTGETRSFNSASSCVRFLGLASISCIQKSIKKRTLIKKEWKVISLKGKPVEYELRALKGGPKRLSCRNVETGEEIVLPTIKETVAFLKLNSMIPIQKALNGKRKSNVINGWEVKYAA